MLVPQVTGMAGDTLVPSPFQDHTEAQVLHTDQDHLGPLAPAGEPLMVKHTDPQDWGGEHEAYSAEPPWSWIQALPAYPVVLLASLPAALQIWAPPEPLPCHQAHPGHQNIPSVRAGCTP